MNRFIVTSVFASLLVAIATALMIWHARSWRAAQALPEDSLERAFAWRQFRRRRRGRSFWRLRKFIPQLVGGGDGLRCGEATDRGW